MKHNTGMSVVGSWQGTVYRYIFFHGRTTEFRATQGQHMPISQTLFKNETENDEGTNGEGLMLETSAFHIFHGGNSNFIN